MAANLAKASAGAVRLLLSQRLYSPKIDVTALSFDKSIVFCTFEGFCGKSRAVLSDFAADGADGYTIRRGDAEAGSYLVLYDGDMSSPGRKRFTLAHEVGHIYLGHECDGKDEESEANRFAAELLIPRVLAWKLFSDSGFSISSHELARVFGVSRQAAENRLNSLDQTLSPVFSDIELRLLKKFGGLLPSPDGPVVDL